MGCLQKINNSKYFAYYLLLLYLQKLKHMSMKLMIGNRVLIKGLISRPATIVEVHTSKVVVLIDNFNTPELVDIEMLEGLSIDESRLNMYGFVPRKDNSLYPRKYWQYGEIEVALYPNLCAIEIAPGYSKAIKHLHELQNIASIIFDQTITKP